MILGSSPFIPLLEFQFPTFALISSMSALVISALGFGSGSAVFSTTSGIAWFASSDSLARNWNAVA